MAGQTQMAMGGGASASAAAGASASAGASAGAGASASASAAAGGQTQMAMGGWMSGQQQMGLGFGAGGAFASFNQTYPKTVKLTGWLELDSLDHHEILKRVNRSENIAVWSRILNVPKFCPIWKTVVTQKLLIY